MNHSGIARSCMDSPVAVGGKGILGVDLIAHLAVVLSEITILISHLTISSLIRCYIYILLMSVDTYLNLFTRVLNFLEHYKFENTLSS